MAKRKLAKDLDDFLSFIRSWSQIKVDINSLKKWCEMKVTKEEIKEILQAKRSL